MLDRRGIIRFGRAYPDLLNPGLDDLPTAREAPAAAAEPPDEG